MIGLRSNNIDTYSEIRRCTTSKWIMDGWPLLDLLEGALTASRGEDLVHIVIRDGG